MSGERDAARGARSAVELRGVQASPSGVHIVAPPGADVSSDGFAVLGDFAHAAHRSPHPDAPVLRIRGISLLGGVTVKIKS